MMAGIDGLLMIMLNKNASQMKLTVDTPPIMMVSGSPLKLTMPPIAGNMLEQFLMELLSQDQQNMLKSEGSCEINYTLDGQAFLCRIKYSGEGLSCLWQIQRGRSKQTFSPMPSSENNLISNRMTENVVSSNNLPEKKEEISVSHANTLDLLLEQTVQMRGSDLLITPESSPMARVNTSLLPLKSMALSSAATAEMLLNLLDDQQKKHFETSNSIDFSYHLSGVGRFRAHLFKQFLGISGAFRYLSEYCPEIDSLNVHLETGVLKKLLLHSHGLVLFTGPTGSGKSTSMAALLNDLNRHHCRHMITIEDPIEYLFKSQSSLVQQREVGKHTNSFYEGLRDSLRENPDIIMVGEMRDLDTISMALTAAETGHLVLSTLHTGNVANTISRIIDVFPEYQQQTVRFQLANSLKAVVAQRLLVNREGSGRVPVFEILKVNYAVSNLIRENKAFQIFQVMEGNFANGMRTMDRSLAELVAMRSITYDVALENAFDRDSFENYLKTASKRS